VVEARTARARVRVSIMAMIFTKTGSRDRVAATHYAHRHDLG
jgi:hypothetical protein